MMNDSNQSPLRRAKQLCLALTWLSSFPCMPAWAADDVVGAAAAERMVAASPHQERYRDWTTCINNVAQLVIAQGGSVQQVRDMIKLGCDDEESRLTGSLIAKFGYERGNAAMRTLRHSAFARFQSKTAQRDQSPNDPDFVETIVGWEVRRTPYGCHAIRIERGAFSIGQVGTMLRRKGNVDSILFVLAGSSVQDVDRKANEAFTVSASRWVRNSFIDIKADFELVPVPFNDKMAYVTRATDSLLAELSDAEKIQFRVPSGRALPSTATFPVSGLAAAWNAVQRCAAR